jgi:hypothetical protein
MATSRFAKAMGVAKEIETFTENWLREITTVPLTPPGDLTAAPRTPPVPQPAQLRAQTKAHAKPQGSKWVAELATDIDSPQYEPFGECTPTELEPSPCSPPSLGEPPCSPFLGEPEPPSSEPCAPRPSQGPQGPQMSPCSPCSPWQAPLPPRPSRRVDSRVHKRFVDQDELMELRAEQAVARHVGVGWKHRGPAGPEAESKHDTWRGQKYRPGSQRWANNGGTRAWWYNAYYPLKRKAADSGREADKRALRDWLESNPMPEKPSGSKGSGKGDESAE